MSAFTQTLDQVLALLRALRHERRRAASVQERQGLWDPVSDGTAPRAGQQLSQAGDDVVVELAGPLGLAGDDLVFRPRSRPTFATARRLQHSRQALVASAAQLTLELRLARGVDADGTVVLAHEVERWNEAADSVVWVRVPQIEAHADNDFIWMYYGNAATGDDQDAGAVWTEFEAVWHLGEASTGGVDELRDSTIHQHHGRGGDGVAERRLQPT